MKIKNSIKKLVIGVAVLSACSTINDAHGMQIANYSERVETKSKDFESFYENMVVLYRLQLDSYRCDPSDPGYPAMQKKFQEYKYGLMEEFKLLKLKYLAADSILNEPQRRRLRYSFPEHRDQLNLLMAIICPEKYKLSSSSALPPQDPI